MHLINRKTGKPLVTGEIVRTTQGQNAIFTGGREPHHAASTGRVWLKLLNDPSFEREFFPSVIDAEWRD
jgi:hypothetical protein